MRKHLHRQYQGRTGNDELFYQDTTEEPRRRSEDARTSQNRGAHQHVSTGQMSTEHVECIIATRAR